MTEARSTYNISTEERKEFYFFLSGDPDIIDLSPSGEATIMSAVSKFEKYTIFFFLIKNLTPTLKKSFSSSPST
jgi:hypothetical protein